MILFWSFFSNGDFTFFSIGVFTFFSFGVFSFFSLGVFSFFSIGLFTFFTGLGLFLLVSPSDVEDVDRGALRTKKDLRKMQKNIIQQLNNEIPNCSIDMLKTHSAVTKFSSKCCTDKYLLTF